MLAVSIRFISSDSSGSLLIAFLILSFISAAALFVNVKIRSSFMWTPFLSLVITRSVSTAVLPEPAPADTIILLPSVLIASSCSFVQLGIFITS